MQNRLLRVYYHYMRAPFKLPYLRPLLNTMSSSLIGKKVVSIDFEIYGRVQGVFFRKYTVEQGKLLGLKGWCMNTERGTVIGTLQGEPGKVAQMKQWLERTGSPKSKIEKAEFKNEKELGKCTFSDFKVRQ